MVLNGGAIAGITIVSALALCVVIWGIYVAIKKRRRDAEYLDRCGRLWTKYGTRKRPEMMAEFPYADATFVRAPVPGQQFTSRELKGDSQGFVVPQRKNVDGEAGEDSERHQLVSMYTPIDPDEINPRMYATGLDQDSRSISPGVPGNRPPQVFFSIEYDDSFNILKVYVDQARHLRPKSYANMCDPYCAVALVPGHTEKQSQVQRRTVDPLFQEYFSFEVPKSHLKEKSVQIKFFDYDQYSRDECTGIVVQRLDEINLDTKVDLWKKIQQVEMPATEATTERAGDILLRLGYLPSAEKLTVVLLKARSLKEVGAEGEKRPPDPYIRVAVLHEGNLLKKKKTSTKRKTSNPTYNQAINFAVPLDVLPQVEIQFHVVHESGVKINRAERKEIIGLLEIGPHSTGDEFEHWRDLMSNKPQARWHHLAVVTEDEHMIASGQSTIASDFNVDVPSTSRKTT